jgi:phage gpG-like protein
MVLAMNFAEAKAKTSFGQEGKPGVKTGTLRRSIESFVYKRADDFIGVLYSNMIYARIHELGGEITPVRKKFLKYNLKGKTIFSKKSVIPARPYIRPALEENIDSLSKIIAKELIRSV